MFFFYSLFTPCSTVRSFLPSYKLSRSRDFVHFRAVSRDPPRSRGAATAAAVAAAAAAAAPLRSAASCAPVSASLVMF